MTPPNKPSNWDEMTPHKRHEWRKANHTNSSGFVGVTETHGGRFKAKIFCPTREKQMHLGTFDSAHEAGKAYEQAFEKIYGSEEEWLKNNRPKPLFPDQKTAATWIRYADRKPAIGTTVIAFNDSIMVIASMWDDGLHDCRECMLIDATHWTNLPNPPQP